MAGSRHFNDAMAYISPTVVRVTVRRPQTHGLNEPKDVKLCRSLGLAVKDVHKHKSHTFRRLTLFSIHSVLQLPLYSRSGACLECLAASLDRLSPKVIARFFFTSDISSSWLQHQRLRQL